jgi:hypothetical protein
MRNERAPEHLSKNVEQKHKALAIEESSSVEAAGSSPLRDRTRATLSWENSALLWTIFMRKTTCRPRRSCTFSMNVSGQPSWNSLHRTCAKNCQKHRGSDQRSSCRRSAEATAQLTFTMMVSTSFSSSNVISSCACFSLEGACTNATRSTCFMSAELTAGIMRPEGVSSQLIEPSPLL